MAFHMTVVTRSITSLYNIALYNLDQCCFGVQQWSLVVSFIQTSINVKGCAYHRTFPALLCVLWLRNDKLVSRTFPIMHEFENTGHLLEVVNEIPKNRSDGIARTAGCSCCMHEG